MMGILLVILVTVCMITDIMNNKIYNKVIFPFICGGIIINIFINGIQGAKSSLVGVIIPIIIFFPFHMCKMLGAGDIKLFAAIGAMMGYEFLINNMIYSFFGAGLVSIFYIIKRRKILDRFKYMFFYLFSAVLAKSIVEYDKEPTKIPFALGIFIGTTVQLTIKCNFF